MSQYPPSKRGTSNLRPDVMIDLSRRISRNQYDCETNPSGIVDLGSALNELMLDDIHRWMKTNLRWKNLRNDLAYGDTQGSPALLMAVADFMNSHFNATYPLTSENILVGNGVTALLNTIAFNIADKGDVMLLPTPSYGMFVHDLTTRNGIRVVQVPCDDILHERFAVSMTEGSAVQAGFIGRLRGAMIAEQRAGRRVAALLLANPENPLGIAYSLETLGAAARLCREFKSHLIVDEIYALTGGSNFNSVLSLRLDKEDFGNIHALWGMSKDFGLGGLRLGFLATYNKKLYETMRTTSMFTWVAMPSSNLATRLLQDSEFLRRQYLPLLDERLNQKRNWVCKQLSSRKIPFVKPNSGTFLFIDLSRFLTWFAYDTDTRKEEALLEYIISCGVFLEPGKAFFSRQLGQFRFNFALNNSVLVVGLNRLLNALRALEEREDDEDGEDDEAKGDGEKTKLARPRFLCF